MENNKIRESKIRKLDATQMSDDPLDVLKNNE